MRGCKTIAELMFREWMVEKNLINRHFTLEVTGNEAVLKDEIGNSLNLVYDSAEKCVRVDE